MKEAASLDSLLLQAAGKLRGGDEHSRTLDRPAVVGRQHSAGDAPARRADRAFWLRRAVTGRLLRERCARQRDEEDGE